MAPYRRLPKTKRPKRIPKYAPYKSMLEKRVAKSLSMYDYEPIKVPYVSEHDYNPDFVLAVKPWLLIEVKGVFGLHNTSGSAEMKKYKNVRTSNPSKEIIFIFGNPHQRAHSGCRPRKDGSVMTLAEWCKKESFLFYGEGSIPPQIVSGTVSRDWIKNQKLKRGYRKC